MTLDEKIQLVTTDLLARFPGCSYTIQILLWDDGTDRVVCRHGDGEKIYHSIYYDNKLTYEEHTMFTNSIAMTAEGKEYCVMTPEEYQNHITPK